MAPSYCPGQDRRFWTPDDIHSVQCPSCGETVELFKDEGKRKCPDCGQIINNPKVLEGCAAWCDFAEACTGILKDDTSGPPGPGGNLSSALIALLSEYAGCTGDEVLELQQAEKLAEQEGINAVYSQGAVKIAFILHTFLCFEKTRENVDLADELRNLIPESMIRNVQEVVPGFSGQWPGGQGGPVPALSRVLESAALKP